MPEGRPLIQNDFFGTLLGRCPKIRQPALSFFQALSGIQAQLRAARTAWRAKCPAAWPPPPYYRRWLPARRRWPAARVRPLARPAAATATSAALPLSPQRQGE